MKNSLSTIKTRLCLISDTHNQAPKLQDATSFAYRQPLPEADIILHAGDISMTGRAKEYRSIIDFLKDAKAELKIVIAGNHDITLDESFYNEIGRVLFHSNRDESTSEIKEMWTGLEARQAGIVYLEEGTKTFHLSNGARFTVYASPWQPEYGTWAFNYHRSTDRFNSGLTVNGDKPLNPIPAWPDIDLVLTHGPPCGILDVPWSGGNVGCEHLLKAIKRCRPRVHCFGHIHEGWGAERVKWLDNTSTRIKIDDEAKVLKERSAYLDISQLGDTPLKFGDETVFVNAAIMDVYYRARNAPWVIDLDLPLVKQPEDSSIELTGITQATNN